MKTSITIIALTALFLVTACETVEGFGKDMEKGGENIEQNARDSE